MRGTSGQGQGLVLLVLLFLLLLLLPLLLLVFWKKETTGAGNWGCRRQIREGQETGGR